MSQESRPEATDWADLPELPSGPHAAAPAKDEVHLWLIELDVPAGVHGACAALLAADETARAERFRFPHLRVRFSVARGAVRQILSRYIKQAPQALRFAYSPQGKPSLCGDGGLRFNVSHSGDLALLAVCRDRRVGVDLELRESKRDLMQIAARTYSAAENAALRRLPEAERTDAFYACWALKEAYLKATGDGLSLPLDGFDVAFPPAASASISVEGWQACSFTVRDHAAALVVEGFQPPSLFRAEWRPQTGNAD